MSPDTHTLAFITRLLNSPRPATKQAFQLVVLNIGICRFSPLESCGGGGGDGASAVVQPAITTLFQRQRASQAQACAGNGNTERTPTPMPADGELATSVSGSADSDRRGKGRVSESERETEGAEAGAAPTDREETVQCPTCLATLSLDEVAGHVERHERARKRKQRGTLKGWLAS